MEASSFHKLTQPLGVIVKMALSEPGEQCPKTDRVITVNRDWRRVALIRVLLEWLVAHRVQCKCRVVGVRQFGAGR